MTLLGLAMVLAKISMEFFGFPFENTSTAEYFVFESFWYFEVIVGILSLEFPKVQNIPTLQTTWVAKLSYYSVVLLCYPHQSE